MDDLRQSPAIPSARRDASGGYSAHGRWFSDPYAWMEQLGSPEAQAWLGAQEAAARAVLDAVPAREQMHAEVARAARYERRAPPIRTAPGGREFFWYAGASDDKLVLMIRRHAGAPAEARPAVVLLPGILGSNLALDGKRIWLGLRLIGGLKRLAWDPATASHVTPDGPIGLTYDDLIEYLAQTHEVIEFAFDWRRPIEDEARRLAGVVDGALQRRDATGQPVRMVAHSMGGLVARTMQLVADDVWRRMMDRSGARLLMLGTPNAGSWAPMQVLSGDDTFGNTLVAFGGLFDDAGTRAVMAAMPGFIQLQAALTDPALGLDSSAKWQALADEDIRRLKERSFWHWDDRQIAVYRWSAPPQAVLDQAVALRRRLDEQATKLGADAQKMLLVVGHDKFTPAGCRMTDDGLEYLDAADGDGRVPLQSALLPGVRTWRCDAAHGKLPDVADAFAAYVELLNNGETGRLPVLDPAAASLAHTQGDVGMCQQVVDRLAQGCWVARRHVDAGLAVDDDIGLAGGA